MTAMKKKTKPRYPARPNAELKQLAIDLRAGRVFCHLQCEPDEISMVFMIFAFMKQADLKELMANPPGLIFESIAKAGPRSCNGLPMFLSCQMISKADADKVGAYVRELEKSEAAVKL